jgi:hypothetical protein
MDMECQNMYSVRRMRRVPVTAWLLPLCVTLIVAIAMIVDYTHEHVHVSVFGQDIDTLSVRQIMVEPVTVSAGNGSTYTVNGHQQVVQFMQLLGQAKPQHQTAAGETVGAANTLDNLYIELGSDTWHVTVQKSQTPHQVLVGYENQLFSVNDAILSTLKQPSS